MDLLRTDEFDRLEAAIKRHALDHLGLDAAVDDLDLYFIPLDTFDFYKSLDLIVSEGDFTISATQMGGGMQNAVVLGILRAFEETRRQGAIILIEESEMFLHPQMQRSLYATLRRLSDTNQIIYTTHSPHFVSIPEYSSVLLVRRTKADGTTVKCSTLSDAEWRREKLRQTLHTERSELFFARRILILEGDTEKLSLPEFAKKLRLDLDGAAATVVDQLAKKVGGVRVWQLDPDYETCVRQAAGDSTYQTLMQRYPEEQFGKGKARRGRMIAADEEMPVPTLLADAIRSLTDGARPRDDVW